MSLETTVPAAPSQQPPKLPPLKALVSRLAGNPLGGVIAALVIIFGASCALSPHFLTTFNMVIIARALAFIGLVTIGQSILMILGELDLSVGAIGGLAGVVGGILMVQLGLNPWLSLGLCLLMGGACGLLNGALITQLRLHSLVLTIGMAGVYGGANLVATKGVAITGVPRDITFLGRGLVMGVPVPFLVLLVCLAIVAFVMLRTPVGRYIYAIGSNPDAARMLGIRVNAIRMGAFALAGFLSALAGILMVARLGTAQPSIGDTWVLGPIAAAVIGGVATTGGIGSPIGAVLGAVIIGIIEDIIVLFGISPYWQSVVSGGIVVLAISFDALARRYLNRDAV
ncbi:MULTISPECIES: ABC transporter permease [Gluconobacter]|uniref:Ribose ABC transporter permease n=6 Tax=Gluconobacter TaxID=441 RepID=A0A829WYS1_GLUOY|nr:MULTISPECIES: ABC transporter permease [Gluconobacter]AHK72240.1 putative ribose ABC transporter permease protein [Gluconobacter oxydans DSM 3504]KXV10500.1 ABC transporter permease [Gluconobacter oxydans]KXV65705.1 ABC transporter permease [Gluconobacter oxydans]MQR99970.1 ABC transporter permease [Gluconobacter aidae]GEM17941.1 ribose ABC transporter permease [Gluconobacter oxydans NBRC 3293]